MIFRRLLISVLAKFGFENNIRWIKLFKKNQESCIIKGGTATKYLELEKGTR